MARAGGVEGPSIRLKNLKTAVATNPPFGADYDNSFAVVAKPDLVLFWFPSHHPHVVLVC